MMSTELACPVITPWIPQRESSPESEQYPPDADRHRAFCALVRDLVLAHYPWLPAAVAAANGQLMASWGALYVSIPAGSSVESWVEIPELSCQLRALPGEARTH